MKKVILTQVLTENGRTAFAELYDENALPVTVELEVDNSSAVMTIARRDLSEQEKDELCGDYESCDDCPICDICEEDEE